MEENNYCLEEMKREADASIKIDALCKFVSCDDESDDEEADRTFEEQELEAPSESMVYEWEDSLKKVAVGMKNAKGWESIGESVDDMVRKLQKQKRRLDAEKIAKKKDNARQAGIQAFFSKKKKPSAGREIEL